MYENKWEDIAKKQMIERFTLDEKQMKQHANRSGNTNSK